MKIYPQIVFILIGLMVMGCAESFDTPEVTGETRTFQYSDEKADTTRGWTVKAPEMTVELDSAMRVEWLQNEPRWVVQGRTTADFVDFNAQVQPGGFAKARHLSPRTFEIVLERHEMLRMAAGDPLMIRLYAGSRGERTYHVMGRYKPGFTAFGGTSKLYVYRWLNAVALNGHDIVFRGRARAPKGFFVENIFTDDDADPELHEGRDWKWAFDFDPARLSLAADQQVDPVYFVIVDSDDTRYRKNATIELRLVQLGITTDDPDDTWPEAVCDAEVDVCLSALDADALDTETCGWANQVLPCLNPQALDE